ncbi:hypothetical protein CH063_10594 [Colletotrichum higginsianum]|uniref:Uncharacterized protein n=1 Tax=Colletotrichum higginsianum (strain IMI 349063) TaxID=759273 RepID=H1VI28_COLHI|nr:hypothetical protein CH063_10594 [Colletotrichum higginsianum]
MSLKLLTPLCDAFWGLVPLQKSFVLEKLLVSFGPRPVGPEKLHNNMVTLFTSKLDGSNILTTAAAAGFDPRVEKQLHHVQPPMFGRSF